MRINKMNKGHIPKIGKRIIKSSIGVFCCFLIYFLRGRQGTPFYSALAVLWCIQPYTRNACKMAFQRTCGTAIGAAFGLLFLLGNTRLTFLTDTVWHYFFLSFMIIPIIYISVLLHKKNASYFSCVVYLSIVVNHLSDTNPYLFVLDRVIDTMIGILLGLIISYIHLPNQYHKDTLYIINIDEILKNNGDQLPSFHIVTINKLIEEGISLTLQTFRTPASILHEVSELKLNLPIIAMDGAVLYDIYENRYEKVYIISPKQATILYDILVDRGFHVFSNIILDDLLIIYYGEFHSEVEADIFRKLRRSPYRNYLKKERPEQHPVVYFMLIDTTQKIEQLYLYLEKEHFTEQFKILHYPSDDYPGYSYIKIYNLNASEKNMKDYLREEILSLALSKTQMLTLE